MSYWERIAYLPNAILGHVIGSNGKTIPIDQSALLKYLQTEKPRFMWTKSLDAGTARTDEKFDLAGDFLMVLNDTPVPYNVRLNEVERDPIPFSRIEAISAPYYRLYISNPAGSGKITLIGGQGIDVRSYPDSLHELAARLGSPVTYDRRRGDIVWYDDFESTTLKWTATEGGSGGLKERVTTSAFRGDASLALKGSGVVVESAQIVKVLALPPWSRIGISYAVAFSSADIDNLETYIKAYDGTSFYWGYFGLDPKHAGAQVSITPKKRTFDYTYVIDTLAYHQVKLVIDLKANKYVRFMLNERDWDISDMPLMKTTSATAPQLEITIQNKTGYTLNIDDVVITQNEP